mmetsp:Transcript_99805/g.251756  ORF Transcript_99805/g.251756 Transcript_99805/m.251756 type:complete len:849 (-) Transcript_99805:164-2710(-)
MTELHPVAKVPDVQETVKFVQAQSFSSLPKPWPRSQDLSSSSFIEPRKDDLVLAVSHAWPYGAHPDPMGNKQSPIINLIDAANKVHKPQGKTLMFCDFLSVSQRPFTAEQVDRTAEESANFAKALRAFPDIYLQADAVLHIDIPTERVPEDGSRYTATLVDLEAAQLVQIGSSVHVVRLNGEFHTCVAPFDVVESIGSVTISCLEDIEHAKVALETNETAAWWWACSSGCSCSDTSVVKMRRAPFGVWSSLSADQKGWVYLERFASMVKGAMVHEDHIHTVAFATSERLLEELHDGSVRLREASKAGKDMLNEALQYFVKQLEQKQFSAVSVDKATNTGGVGGVSSAEPSPSQSTDQQIVVSLMKELVGHLAKNWEQEQRSQRQRQLTMSVSRGDVEATRQLVALGADPNLPDSQGLTCLHTAARVRELPIVEALVELGGDLTVKDVQGNLPAHRLGLYAKGLTVELFNALAPTQALLDEPNKAGVTPFMRLAAWAYTAVASKPYPPGVELIEKLKKQYPSLVLTAAIDASLEIGLERGVVKETTEEYVVRGRPMHVHKWQTPNGQADLHILWIGFQLYMPEAMQKSAVQTVAEYVCPRLGAELIALLEPFEAASRSEYDAGIQGLLEALPLQGMIAVVDNSMGVATRCIWEARSRISAALVINPLGWFSDDFYGSEAHTKILGVVNSHARHFADRDIDAAASMVGNFVYSQDSDDVDRVKDLYSQCLSSADDRFWKSQPFVPKLIIEEATPDLKSLDRLDNTPVLFLCGSHSPALLVQESTARLQERVDNAAIEYIPSSKQWWEVEGQAQVVKVARTIVQMLESCDADFSVSLSGMLQRGLTIASAN